jgi:hypothetical protein
MRNMQKGKRMLPTPVHNVDAVLTISYPLLICLNPKLALIASGVICRK